MKIREGNSLRIRKERMMKIDSQLTKKIRDIKPIVNKIETNCYIKCLNINELIIQTLTHHATIFNFWGFGVF